MTQRSLRAAYIGILTSGSTSRMRAEVLRKLTPGWEWQWIDTDAPMKQSHRLWQTAAFRYNTGNAVNRINELVSSHVLTGHRNLAWVDKAVFLWPSTMNAIRRTSHRLLHFTPDTAFHANRSRHFERTLPAFDLVVTTKSFELAEYERRIDREKIFLTTQGFDPGVHYPRVAATDKSRDAAFAGLAEPDRERAIAALLEQNIGVRLAGEGWDGFLRKWQNHPKLEFVGAHVFGKDYADFLSRSWVCLGLLSKRFPELHTTRTFEIPACQSILATEATTETRNFFSDDEALFFDNHEVLATKLNRLFSESPDEELARTAAAGMERVLKDKRDYPSLLGSILSDPRVSL